MFLLMKSKSIRADLAVPGCKVTLSPCLSLQCSRLTLPRGGIHLHILLMRVYKCSQVAKAQWFFDRCRAVKEGVLKTHHHEI